MKIRSNSRIEKRTQPLKKKQTRGPGPIVSSEPPRTPRGFEQQFGPITIHLSLGVPDIGLKPTPKKSMLRNLAHYLVTTHRHFPTDNQYLKTWWIPQERLKNFESSRGGEHNQGIAFAQMVLDSGREIPVCLKKVRFSQAIKELQTIQSLFSAGLIDAPYYGMVSASYSSMNKDLTIFDPSQSSPENREGYVWLLTHRFLPKGKSGTDLADPGLRYGNYVYGSNYIFFNSLNTAFERNLVRIYESAHEAHGFALNDAEFFLLPQDSSTVPLIGLVDPTGPSTGFKPYINQNIFKGEWTPEEIETLIHNWPSESRQDLLRLMALFESSQAEREYGNRGILLARGFHLFPEDADQLLEMAHSDLFRPASWQYRLPHSANPQDIWNPGVDRPAFLSELESPTFSLEGPGLSPSQKIHIAQAI